MITKVISISILTLLLFTVIKKIVEGKFKSIYVIYCVYYIFFVLPLLLDIIYGVPRYLTSPGFQIASNDSLVGLIYNIYILIPPLIWFKYSKRVINFSFKKGKTDNKTINTKKASLLSFYILMIIISLPLALLLFSPNMSLYSEYGGVLSGMNDEERSYHTILRLSTTISIVTIAITLLKSKQLVSTLILLSPFLIVNFWINGKRSIVALSIVLIFFIIWKKRNLRGLKLLIVGVLAVTSIFLFSSLYQSNIREFDERTFQEKYENYRADYGRDDVMKLVIYNEINKDMSILEHRGQSLLFYTTMYIPRDLWEEKPLPYAQYITSALFLTEPQLWGWGMTTSILDESIANFGLLGVLIGPLIILVICRIGDSADNFLLTMLSIIICVFLLTVHLVAFFPMFLVWLLLIILNKRKQKKVKPQQIERRYQLG